MSLRDLFLLDPEVTFLNHGSFGACPAPVFEVYQRWQRELERRPIEFLARRSGALRDTARADLGSYLNADPDDLLFLPNATVALNMVARSLPLEPGDEILSTDHEYGAIDRLWTFIARKTGARYVRQPIPLPVTTPDALVDSLWKAVTDRTKAIFISHITSPTALILPVAEICRRAREAGIFTIIDGAHAPGQIPLDLAAVEADFYAGNCHKWLCSPKGAGFLHARRDHHALLEPLVISWGWQPEGAGTLVSRNQWQGTRDMAAYLAVPAAIDFLREHDWDAVRTRCHALARETRRRLADLTGIAPIQPDSPEWFAQMVAAPLPDCDPDAVQARLYDEHHIEVPLIDWHGRTLIRVSYQGYNNHDDTDRLINALAAVLAG